MREDSRHVRILDEVRGGVGGRERDRDDEICGDEAEQDEDEEFALPMRQQMFEHRNRAFAVRTLFGDMTVDRICAEEREQDENERGDGRERAGREKGAAGLITERRE